MIRNIKIGKRYDSGKSPLQQGPVVLAAPEPTGGVLDVSEPFNHAMPNSWSVRLQTDYDAILNGKLRDDLMSEWAGRWLVAGGYTSEQINNLNKRQRAILCDRLVRAAKRAHHTRSDALLEQMLRAPRDPLAQVPGGRNETMSLDVKMRGAFQSTSDTNKKARTALHVRLRAWNAGPLKLERPQGSSLHHLADYDAGNTPLGEDDPEMVRRWFADCQIVLVENDWGAAVPEIEGEWRVPFAFICWEFRISGVRVLAFTEADREPNIMWCCYGADGHWVVDDFRYELGCPALPRGIKKSDVDAVEFRRVAAMVYNTIRASCIMLDAQVARHEPVVASSKLVERRAREGRAPPRNHYVVRLLHQEQRSYHRARSAGGGVGVARSPQRGHWRKGTWVHYDDQDSGQVQYANKGGFMVSKTWRRWHFAGNPNDIIHKEYRL